MNKKKSVFNKINKILLLNVNKLEKYLKFCVHAFKMNILRIHLNENVNTFSHLF